MGRACRPLEDTERGAATPVQATLPGPPRLAASHLPGLNRRQSHLK